MRKLTKFINKRRKNYQPTIGLVTEKGKTVSINAVEFYIALAKERERKAQAETHRLMYQFMREEMPEFCRRLDFMGSICSSWPY